jgi:hypothetical protein
VPSTSLDARAIAVKTATNNHCLHETYPNGRRSAKGEKEEKKNLSKKYSIIASYSCGGK